MKQIEALSLAKYYGSREVFRGVSCSLCAGDRVGVTGVNGTGKTTLLKCLAGLEEPSEGTVRLIPDTLRLGFVAQEPRCFEGETVRQAVLRDVRQLEQELRAAEEALAAESGGLERAMNHYSAVRDRWDRIDGDQAPERAEGLLTAMGLGERLDLEAGRLSGGERSVLSLCEALLKQPEVLILDEPGNHLDIQGFTWLEEFLDSFRGTVLTVSHNRYFLDRICRRRSGPGAGRIWELGDGTLKEYKGNYSDYRFSRMQERISCREEFKSREKKIRQLEEMVKRFTVIASARPDPAWGQRLKAAKSRLKQEQGRQIENPAAERGAPDFQLAAEAVKSSLALQLQDYSVAAGRKPLLRGISCQIQCGEKVGLIGPNGCGKSTLLRRILAEEEWDGSRVRIGPGLKVGFVAQNPQFDHPERSLVEEVRSWGPLTRDQAFGLLKPFQFSWEEMEKEVAALSGGESRRVQLARCMYEKATFLILDEPTNHLDLAAREAVEEALLEYRGTLLVVSHDRYFLDRIAERILAVEDQAVTDFSGSFTAYWADKGCKRGSGRIQTRAQERAQKRAQNRSQMPGSAPESPEALARIEADIDEREQARNRLEKEAKEAFARGALEECRKCQGELAVLNRRIDELYRQWDSLSG